MSTETAAPPTATEAESSRPTVYARDLHLAENLSPEQEKMRDALINLARASDPHSSGYEYTETAETVEYLYGHVVTACQGFAALLNAETVPATAADQTPDAEVYNVPCGCDVHGDHLGCDAQCSNFGCSRSLAVDKPVTDSDEGGELDVVQGAVWAWLNRHDAPWSPSDAKVLDLALAIRDGLTPITPTVEESADLADIRTRVEMTEPRPGVHEGQWARRYACDVHYLIALIARLAERDIAITRIGKAARNMNSAGPTRAQLYDTIGEIRAAVDEVRP